LAQLLKLFLLSSEISSSEKPLNLENSIVCGVSTARFSISLNNSGFSESKFSPSASITSLIVSPFIFFLYFLLERQHLLLPDYYSHKIHLKKD